MSFKAIKEVKDFGILKDIERGRDDIPDFSGVNLVYGWNYSGKTTLTRIFRSLEKGSVHPDFSQGTFSLILSDNTEVNNKNLDAVTFPIKVFNSDYVKENLVWSKGVEPIFIVGEENIQLQRRRDFLSGLIEKRYRYKEKLKEKIASTNRLLEEKSSESAQKVRQQLGKTPFNRSPHFQKYVDEVMENGGVILTEDDYIREFKKLKSEKKDSIELDFSLPEVEELYQDFNKILAEKVQQSVIDRVKEDESLEKWIEEGLNIHKGEKYCQFCLNPISDNLLEAYSKHFSDSLNRLKINIQDIKGKLNSAKINYTLFDPDKLYSDLKTAYEAAVSLFNSNKNCFNSFIDAMINDLDEKEKNPDKEYQPEAIYPEDCIDNLKKILNDIVNIKEKHNERSKNHEQERESSLERLIVDEAAKFVVELDYPQKLEDISNYEERIEANTKQITRLEEEVNHIENKISDEVRGAEEINYILKTFFGKNDIYIRVRQDKKYELVRSGNIAKNLSEGEKTAISFAYFVAELNNKDVEKQNCVVVIDDPISSLDSNHMYNTFSIIKSHLSKVKQIILLTHNYELFRVAKTDSFFSEKKKSKKVGQWYLISRIDKEKSVLVDIPDMLRKYNSEYHYIFYVLLDYYYNPSSYPELNFNIPNLVRKLLETYTSFRVPKTTYNLNDRINILMEDESISIRVYKFINHLSHSDGLSYALEFPSSEECVQVIGHVFAMMKRQDPMHFDGIKDLALEVMN